MELGGNISLEGFDSLEPATLVVLKKIVGNYARKISEIRQFNKLIITYSKPELEAKLELDGKELKEKESGDNLFVILADVLNRIVNLTKAL